LHPLQIDKPPPNSDGGLPQALHVASDMT